MPSTSATGWAWIVGIAFMAAHARACFPFLNSTTRFSWHAPQVSSVGSVARAMSVSSM